MWSKMSYVFVILQPQIFAYNNPGVTIANRNIFWIVLLILKSKLQKFDSKLFRSGVGVGFGLRPIGLRAGLRDGFQKSRAPGSARFFARARAQPDVSPIFAYFEDWILVDLLSIFMIISVIFIKNIQSITHFVDFSEGWKRVNTRRDVNIRRDLSTNGSSQEIHEKYYRVTS